MRVASFRVAGTSCRLRLLLLLQLVRSPVLDLVYKRQIRLLFLRMRVGVWHARVNVCERRRANAPHFYNVLLHKRIAVHYPVRAHPVH